MNRICLVLLVLSPLLLCARPWQFKFSAKISDEEVKAASLSGTLVGAGKSAEVKDGTVCQLSKYSGKIKRGTKLRAAAVTVVDMPEDCERYIGIGADWFVSCFVNGQLVLSTEPGGNRFSRISPYNHIVKVKFKKGANHLALYIRPRLYQWKFAFKIMPDVSQLPTHSGDRARMISQMFPPANPGLLRKELVHQLSYDSAAVSCQFGSAVICGVRFKAEKDGQSKIIWNTLSGKRIARKNHRFQLKKLLSDTVYDYEIVTLDTNTAKITPVSSGSFKTFPATGVDSSFMIISDTQVAPDIRQTAVKNMLKLPEFSKADFVVSLGDVAENFDNFEMHYFNWFLNGFYRKNQLKPLTIVKGNHEYRGNGSDIYPEHFGRSYYSFRHGEVFFIVLDTGEGGDTVWQPGHHLLFTDTAQLLAEQQEWLERITASEAFKSAAYRIVLSHASPFKYHAKFYGNTVRKLAGKFFFGAKPAHRIDLWLCAHVHYASRFDPATKKMVGFKFPKRSKLKVDADDLADINFPVITSDGPGQGGEQLSVTSVNVSDDGIKVKMTTPEGKVIDDVIIRKGAVHEVKSSVLEKLF